MSSVRGATPADEVLRIGGEVVEVGMQMSKAEVKSSSSSRKSLQGSGSKGLTSGAAD